MSAQWAFKIRRHVVKKQRACGRVAPQLLAVVRPLAAAIQQRVSNGLIHGYGSFGRAQVNGPVRGGNGFGSEIHAEGDAELALRAVGVLFEFRASLIGSEVHVGRLDRLAGDAAYGAGELVMEKSRDGFVVGEMAQLALVVAEREGAGADLPAEVTPQGANVVGMNQSRDGRVATRVARPRGFRGGFPLRRSPGFVAGSDEDSGATQHIQMPR